VQTTGGHITYRLLSLCVPLSFRTLPTTPQNIRPFIRLDSDSQTAAQLRCFVEGTAHFIQRLTSKAKCGVCSPLEYAKKNLKKGDTEGDIEGSL